MLTLEEIQGLEKAEKEMASLRLVVLDATQRLGSIEISQNRIQKKQRIGQKVLRGRLECFTNTS